MGTPRRADPRRMPRLGGRAGLLPLHLDPDLHLPLRQEVRLPSLPPAQLAVAVRSTLDAAGFAIVSGFGVRRPGVPDGSHGSPPPYEGYGERGRTMVPMSSASKTSVYTILGAGLGLGIFDAVSIGAPLVAFPWVGGAVAITILLWLRYGRSFQSDVVAVVLRPTRATAPTAPEGTMVVLLGGRVRSDVRAGDRTGHSAAAAPAVARALGQLARELERQLVAATPN
jgi:hypothetical protein